MSPLGGKKRQKEMMIYVVFIKEAFTCYDLSEAKLILNSIISLVLKGSLIFSNGFKLDLRNIAKEIKCLRD